MDIQAMMQQAKQMQDRMKEMQDRLGTQEVIGESGGGLVKVTMTCKGEVKAIDISADLISKDEKETLEDLLVAAISVARTKSEETMSSETQKMMEEFGIPGNIDLPGF